MVAIRNMSLLSSSKTVSELFGGVRVMIARACNDFARYQATRRREIQGVGMLIAYADKRDLVLLISRMMRS